MDVCSRAMEPSHCKAIPQRCVRRHARLLRSAPRRCRLQRSELLTIKPIGAAGGAGPYAFTVTSGTLPAGLSLSASGLLSGTATGAGTFSFGVTAAASGVCTGVQTITITVSPTTVVGGSPIPIPTLSQWAIALLLGARFRWSSSKAASTELLGRARPLNLIRPRHRNLFCELKSR